MKQNATTSEQLTDHEPGRFQEQTRGAVVIGYDGSEPAKRALEWAVQETLLRATVLVPAVVVPPIMTYDLPAAPSEAMLTQADQLLDEASRLARTQAPDIRVTPLTVVAPPAQGLLELAENAAVIVVGSRGRGGVAAMMLGSVSLRVAQNAACPTVVLPAGANKRGAEHQIVVGLDGSAPSEAALSFAVSEAMLHQARLIAVHSVADPYLGSGFMPPAPELIQALEQAGQQFLHENLEPWRRKHPEIAITDVLIHEPAGTALPLRAADADLLVIGARGRGTFAGMLLGSVSHAVLHAASVPVAVVRGAQPAAQ